MALILDTGPLFALLDRKDERHAQCVDLLKNTSEVRIIPAPVLVEVDWLVNARLHGGVLSAFLADITDGAYFIENLESTDYQRIREICDLYADARVGFVDASILAVVERLNEPKLATLDRRHFGMMRPRHIESLQLLPE